MKKRWLWIILFLLLLFPVLAGADVSYAGKKWPEDTTYMKLGNFVVKDFKEFYTVLAKLPNLKRVDMWKNRMTKKQCDALAARFPNIKWGWTMVIKGKDHQHLVRTDYTAFSTLHNNRSSRHTSEDFSILKYCWNLKGLDIGHNAVESLDFLYDLPELRVLIVGANQVKDIKPLASLKHLEYAELFNNKITDVSPLKDLPHLLDLNLSFNKIKDLTPLTKLKTLQRLWLFSSMRFNTSPPAETVHKLRKALPKTQIDTVHHPTTGGWRYIRNNKKHPHYEVITQMFGEDHLHPKHKYVPFKESWTNDKSSSSGGASSSAKKSTLLPLLKVQDFSDRKYLLPISFKTGSTPKKKGFNNKKQSYSDSTIQVTTGHGNTGKCEYWYAKISLTDASQLRTMAASKNGGFKTAGEMNGLNLAKKTKAVVAINGDFWNSKEKRGMGYIVRQGILYQNNLAPDRTSSDSILMDVLLIDEDGDFIVFQQPTKNSIPALVNGKRILNAFSFGPILVKNGKAVKNYNHSDCWLDMAADKPRQRMCICQTGPLQYMVLCCAGPYKGNTGMTLKELGKLAAKLGAKTAYNLDGGYSTMLYFHGNLLNSSGNASPRMLMDVIYFASAE